MSSLVQLNSKNKLLNMNEQLKDTFINSEKADNSWKYHNMMKIILFRKRSIKKNSYFDTGNLLIIPIKNEHVCQNKTDITNKSINLQQQKPNSKFYTVIILFCYVNGEIVKFYIAETLE